MGEVRTEWHGTNPYCLVISERGGSATLIDVDEPNWMKAYSHLMRAQGQWILARKEGSVPVLTLLVNDGDQPYYTAKVYNSFLPPPDWLSAQEIVISPETIKEFASVRAYGIGKKHATGVDRMWVLPNGVVCAGDDVEYIGAELARTKLHEIIERMKHNGGHSGQDRQGGSQEGGVHEGQAGQDR